MYSFQNFSMVSKLNFFALYQNKYRISSLFRLSNKFLRTETRVRIYKTMVRPILKYVAETRPDTAKTRQMLETAEMKTLRRILINKQGKTTGENVESKRSMTGSNVEERIGTRTWKV